MRLDEWQKFIESQFLDENVREPLAAKPASKPAGGQQTLLSLDDEPIIISTDTPSETRNGHALLPASDIDTSAPEPPSSHVVPRSAQAPATLQQTGFVVRSIVEPTVDVPEPLPAVSPVPFASQMDMDAEIPVFADYLPSKPPEPEQEFEEVQTIANLLAGESHGPVSVILPLTSGFVPTPKTAVRPVSAENAVGTAERRRKRAPQARNVPSQNVASGLSSAELWSKVPRHVQTLLALERREEEREVAQSSYKRPFQEKRSELIARILDPILSLEDTARLLNVCPTTVRRYTNKGILTYYRKEPDNPTANSTERETRQRRFRLSDILTFLETQETALEADRLQERVAPGRRKRAAASIESSDQE